MAAEEEHHEEPRQQQAEKDGDREHFHVSPPSAEPGGIAPRILAKPPRILFTAGQSTRSELGTLMKTAVFSSKSYDEDFFTRVNADHGHEFSFLAARLDETTVDLAKDHQAVCVFVN